MQDATYDRCVDDRIKADPHNYCLQSLITEDLDFTLWSMEQTKRACFEAAEVMQEKCKEAECDPCAITVAYMFTKYERQVQMAVEGVVE